MIDQTFYKKNILNLIDYKKNRSEGYIMPIMNSFENNILRVERGMYFKIGGKYYEVKGIPIIDNGIVEAQEVLEDDFNDFPKKYYFTSSEVLSNMVSFQEVQGLIVERLERNKKDKTLNILNIILK